jgi:hypothetical protein
MALEWRSRHGRLPRASDWSTAKAARAGTESLQRLRDPPHGAARWPPASTVNNRFGSWEAFREACDADVAPQEVWTRVQQLRDGRLRIGVLGDTRVVERAYGLWSAARQRTGDDELSFVVWTVLQGRHASASETHSSLYARILTPAVQANLIAGKLEIPFDTEIGLDEATPATGDRAAVIGT